MSRLVSPFTLARAAARRVWHGREAVVVVVIYVVCAMAFYGSLDPVSATQLPRRGAGDASSIVWYLDWVYYALAHGLNPLVSHAVNYPTGIDLMANTSSPLLGVLMAPVTALGGPVAALNLLLRLSLVVSAAAMFFVLRRFTTWKPSAAIGGLLYGFSPFMAGQGASHPFLTFAPLPPLALLLVDEALVRQRWSPWWAGAALGLCAGLEVLVSPEVLAITLLAAIGGIVVLLVGNAALRQPDRLRRALRELLSGAGVFVVIAAYPIWLYLRGIAHLHGAPHLAISLQPFHADLTSPLVPTTYQWLSPSSLSALAASNVNGTVAELGVYLGLPLLAVLGEIVLRCRRSGIVAVATLVGAGAFVLSLGPRLFVAGSRTPVQLPFKVLQRLPLLDGIEADRFALIVTAAAAVVLAVGLDRFVTRAGSPSRPPVEGVQAERRHRRRAAIGLVVVAVALVPLLPDPPDADADQGIALASTYFGRPAADAIPAGSVVLVYPNAGGPYGAAFYPQAMLWQAQSGMTFSQIGYYGAGSSPPNDPTAAFLRPGVVQELLSYALYGPRPGVPRPPHDQTTFDAIRLFLTRYHVGTIVVAPLARWQVVLNYVYRALGKRPKVSSGVLVWYRVAAVLSERAQPAVAGPAAARRSAVNAARRLTG